MVFDVKNKKFIKAIGHIAKAKGMAQIAKDTGLGREVPLKHFDPMPSQDLTR